MNTTKLTYLFIAALLTTTHHHQTKTGVVGSIIGVAVVSVAAIYCYNKLQESQKSEVDKAVDVTAETTKKGLNALVDKIKSISEK